MKWLVKWGVKKYALDFINGLLEQGKDGVQKTLAIVDVYIGYAEKVLAFLKSLREKLSDNKIEDEEADAIIAEAETLINDIIQ